MIKKIGCGKPIFVFVLSNYVEKVVLFWSESKCLNQFL